MLQFDILAQAANLLASESATDDFMDGANLQYTANGSRLYSELNTGDWWAKTEKMDKMPEDAVLLPIILYTDGTWLSKSGSHSAKPLSMTLGNFPRHVMNQNESKKVVKYIKIWVFMVFYHACFRFCATCRNFTFQKPSVPANCSRHLRGSCTMTLCTTCFDLSDAHRPKAVFWRCITAGKSFFSKKFCLNSPLQRRTKLFMPVICAIVNDNPEGQLLCLTYDSSKAQKPCRSCW